MHVHPGRVEQNSLRVRLRVPLSKHAAVYIVSAIELAQCARVCPIRVGIISFAKKCPSARVCVLDAQEHNGAYASTSAIFNACNDVYPKRREIWARARACILDAWE